VETTSAAVVPMPVSVISKGFTLVILFAMWSAAVCRPALDGVNRTVNVVLPAGQTSGDVPVVVTVNGVASAPKPVSIVTAAPGVFSIPAGAGYGVLIFADPDDRNIAKIAAPVNANIGYPTAPIARGSNCFFYATGLGPLSPPLKEGAVDLTTLHNAAVTPIVLVGGITARVDFAGAAPQFPGVYQINIGIPQNAPTGDNVTLQVRSADGSVTSSTSVVISVK